MKTFEDFWMVWPKSTRKGAKAVCLRKWTQGYMNTCADQIIKHVEWMKTTDDWRKNNGAFIPAPLVYLNQQRWDGAEVSETRPTASVVDQRAIWKAEDAKAAKPSSEQRAKIAALLRPHS